jgi:hypothetical protein
MRDAFDNVRESRRLRAILAGMRAARPSRSQRGRSLRPALYRPTSWMGR